VDWIHPTQVKVNMVGPCEEGNEFLGSTESVVSWPAERLLASEETLHSVN
jgi:hypothetical protein